MEAILRVLRVVVLSEKELIPLGHSLKFWLILVTILYILTMLVLFLWFRRAMQQMAKQQKEKQQETAANEEQSDTDHGQT